MKLPIAQIAFALAAIIAAPAVAQSGSSDTKAEVVERDAKGQATRVSIGGATYDVCSPAKQDDCINPREAGLNFGNVPLDHWPGQPASQMDKKD